MQGGARRSTDPLRTADRSFGSEYVLNGSYLPDLVVVADPRGMINVINECNLKNVPTMGAPPAQRLTPLPTSADLEISSPPRQASSTLTSTRGS